jgi:hypothetical protein
MEILLGHLFGDYLLQNNWMALNKKKNIFACIIHCLIYTACIIIFMYNNIQILSPSTQLLIIILLFASHIILDGTNIVDHWFGMIKGRSFKSVENYINNSNKTDIEKNFYISYTTLVQTMADNTLHLFFMYLIFKFLCK